MLTSALHALVVTAEPLLTHTSPAWINASLGRRLDGTGPQFPTPEKDVPTLQFATAPDLSPVAALLGPWLDARRPPDTSRWVEAPRGVTEWAPNDELAAVYRSRSTSPRGSSRASASTTASSSGSTATTSSGRSARAPRTTASTRSTSVSLRRAPTTCSCCPDRLAASAPAPASRPGRRGDFKLTEWDALVPKDWDPMKEFKDLNLGAMRDGDPRATAALERLKRAFDNAPMQPALNDTRIRIAGFVVPLEAEGGLLREFLLVPYFGACIHSPPPPANQIIHVSAATPIKGFRAMDPVWVSGTLRTGISDTPMGTSGYRLEVATVAPYREGK